MYSSVTHHPKNALFVEDFPTAVLSEMQSASEKKY
jgi:hypothetical protein